jgi:hypothetical protein
VPARRNESEETKQELWDQAATRAYRAIVTFLLCPLVGPFSSLRWLWRVSEHLEELSPAGRRTFYAAVVITVVGIIVHVALLGVLLVLWSL